MAKRKLFRARAPSRYPAPNGPLAFLFCQNGKISISMKQLWKNSEWRWVLIVSVCVILLSNTPYLYAAFHHPTNKIFTGIHNINPGDTYSYVAWIEQAKEGESLFQDLYTTEKQEVLLFHPVFFSLGLLARIFHLTSIFEIGRAHV